jgi:hypothetical protein
MMNPEWLFHPRESARKHLYLDPEILLTDVAPNQRNTARLNDVIRSFANGYNAGLHNPLGPIELSGIPHRLRGFAVEGAAMSRTLLDLLTLGRGRRLRSLATAHGDRYIHLVYVGAGWAFARLRLPPWTATPLRGWSGVPFGGDAPVLRHLAWDGWGFHQAFFRADRVFGRHRVEVPARGGARPVRDQGVGRALWFHARAEPERTGEIIATFPEPRRPDLWAGVGLAASYTGVLAPGQYDTMLGQAGDFRAALGQGAAFAAKAHLLSGTIPPDSRACVEALTGCPAETAADWTDEALRRVMDSEGRRDIGEYQRWRALIQAAWSRQNGGVSL